MKLNDSDFKKLSTFVGDRYGINLKEKRTLIETRLSFDMSKRGYNSFSSYISYVTAFPESDECQHMINRLSTNYSFFFRETNYISHLKNKAVPEFLKRGHTKLSALSVGCSQGQEAYSVAMVLSSLAVSKGFSFSITGIDINTEVLEMAKHGVYPIEELEKIPAVFRQYVKQINPAEIEICDHIKSHLTWKKENILSFKIPSTGYDIVFCRNVLIYFSPETRKLTADKLYDAIKNGGYLYTGAMETMDFRSRRFKYLAPSVYVKG